MPPSQPPIEQLFGDFLERVEAEESADIDALCAAHPAVAADLRRMYARWQALTQAFTELSTSMCKPAVVSGPAPAVDALMVRLTNRGARLSRYAIGEELARGTMGRVVVAWDEGLRREVALKIQRAAGDDARQRRRFLEEAQIAAQLDHPGIVPIHELGLDEAGRPFFSMKLVRGRHLGEVLDLVATGRNGWTRTRIIDVFVRVCEAVAYAHGKGVVHRDLKPANIMVGSFGETYVMDWGLARVHSADGAAGGTEVDTLRAEVERDSESSPLLTRHGDIVGTPAYMAPEQAEGGATAAAPAVDIYAIGAMLYHLLAGQRPYGDGHAETSTTLLARLRRGPPRPLPATVPAELQAICALAMARRPDQRYASVADLGNDLRAFLEGRAVRAHATDLFTDLGKWVRRNRALASALTALLVLLVVTTLVVTTLWLRAEWDRARADSGAALLQMELDRSAFRGARQALRLNESIEAIDSLWRAHLAGRMSRATAWALAELYEHDPYLLTVPMQGNRPATIALAAGVVLVGTPDGLEVRDLETLELRTVLATSDAAITSVAAPADRAIALAGTATGDLILVDLAAHSEIARRRHHHGEVTCIAVGGNHIVTGGADGRVLLWSAALDEPRIVQQFDTRISSLIVTPKGDGMLAGDVGGRVAGGAFDGSWYINLLIGSQVTALACGAVESELWVGTTDQLVRFFDFLDNSRNWSRRTDNGTCRQLVRDRDGTMLAGGWWRTSRLAADGSREEPVALRGVWKMALDADRQLLLTAGKVCGLGIVDVSRRGERRRPGWASALSADGRRIAIYGRSGIVVYDIDSDTEVSAFDPGAKGGLVLDPEGRRLAVVDGRSVRVFDVQSSNFMFGCDGPADNPFGASVAFSPDGAELAVCVGPKSVHRLRASDGTKLAEYAFSGSRTIRITWAADGSALAVIGRNSSVVSVFHIADGRCEEIAVELPQVGGEESRISAVALSPDGRRLAAGTWAGAIVVRDADGSSKTIAAHDGVVWSLQFNMSDPGLLVSSGGSSGVRFWDIDSGECCLHTLRGASSSVQLSRDGRTLACQRNDEAVLLDLTYRERHIAGHLEYQLERQSAAIALDAARVAGLRAWAAEVLRRPWPRW